MFAIFETFINIYNSNPSFPYSIDLVYLHSAYILYDQTKIQELLRMNKNSHLFQFSYNISFLKTFTVPTKLSQHPRTLFAG